MKIFQQYSQSSIHSNQIAPHWECSQLQDHTRGRFNGPQAETMLLNDSASNRTPLALNIACGYRTQGTNKKIVDTKKSFKK